MLSILPGTVLPQGTVIDALLMSGGLSNVWHATHNRRHIVAKTFRLDPEWTDQQRVECEGYFANEAHYLEVLHHERLAAGLGTISVSSGQVILIDFIPGVNLRLWMDQHGHPRPLEHCLKVAATCADGLHYLHSQRLIHRDIAPRNIMVDDACNATLIDFQFVCPSPTHSELGSSHHGKMSYGIGHWAFTAPEVMDGFDRQYDERADIFSLGAVVIEMVAGRPPRRRPPIAHRADIPPGLSDLLWAMVDELPSNRPHWLEIQRMFTP